MASRLSHLLHLKIKNEKKNCSKAKKTAKKPKRLFKSENAKKQKRVKYKKAPFSSSS